MTCPEPPLARSSRVVERAPLCCLPSARPAPAVSAVRSQRAPRPPTCPLTGCWGRVQVHIFTVLAIAGLVAAPNTQHVHRACVRVLKQGTGAPHLLSPLPAGRTRLGRRIGAPELNGIVPGRWRVGGQPPAQEYLVVGKGALRVDDGSLGHCGKRQRGSVRTWSQA